MSTFISHSVSQTQTWAKKLAKRFQSSGGVITLSGDLGAGKTTFVQGFAAGLAVKDRILSPTFLLIRTHPIPQKNRRLYHIDLYRIEKLSSLEDLGLTEIFADQMSVSLIEWPERLGNLLPDKVTTVEIKRLSETKRQITVTWSRMSAA